jgi:hypothetical protein
VTNISMVAFFKLVLKTIKTCSKNLSSFNVSIPLEMLINDATSKN